MAYFFWVFYMFFFEILTASFIHSTKWLHHLQAVEELSSSIQTKESLPTKACLANS
jgi:hypothetical protein